MQAEMQQQRKSTLAMALQLKRYFFSMLIFMFRKFSFVNYGRIVLTFF
jgi:hypothetical protein